MIGFAAICGGLLMLATQISRMHRLDLGAATFFLAVFACSCAAWPCCSLKLPEVFNETNLKRRAERVIVVAVVGIVIVATPSLLTWWEYAISNGGYGLYPKACRWLSCPSGEFILGFCALAFGPVLCFVARQCTGIGALSRAVSGQEGKLQDRLADGTIRLLNPRWLLAQTDTFRLTRCQELPQEAFVPPSEVVSLLGEGQRVAALSYGWLSGLLRGLQT